MTNGVPTIGTGISSSPRRTASRSTLTRLASRSSGIVKSAGLRPIRLHDLRHTHASLALKAGVPVKVISERLGHESPAFTLKQYAHVIPGMQAEAANCVAQLVAQSGASQAG